MLGFVMVFVVTVVRDAIAIYSLIECRNANMSEVAMERTFSNFRRPINSSNFKMY